MPGKITTERGAPASEAVFLEDLAQPAPKILIDALDNWRVYGPGFGRQSRGNLLLERRKPSSMIDAVLAAKRA